MMSYEEIKPLRIKKGDRVRYKSGGRSIYEATINRVYSKKSYYGRDNGKPYYEFSLTDVVINGEQSRDLLEDHFDELEKIEVESSFAPTILIEGQSAEELVFNWTSKDLKEFAKELSIVGRSKMNKSQLAMAIEELT